MEGRHGQHISQIPGRKLGISLVWQLTANPRFLVKRICQILQTDDLIYLFAGFGQDGACGHKAGTR